MSVVAFFYYMRVVREIGTDGARYACVEFHGAGSLPQGPYLRSRLAMSSGCSHNSASGASDGGIVG